jgi:calcineurin-like phosphoesterase family protein
MNQGLIDRWNERVGKNDVVYHLGDFCLTTKIDLIDEWLSQLNGTIRLVKGNHDVWIKKLDRLEYGHKIEWIRDYSKQTVMIDDQKHQVVMFHFPIMFWENSHHGSVHLHGHCHGNAQNHNKNLRRFDVGVDCNDWYPVLLDDVVRQLVNKDTNPHHND